MVKPVTYILDTTKDKKQVVIEPVFEEIAGGDLFPTGRYVLSDSGHVLGEIHLDGELFEWDGLVNPGYQNLLRISQFIREYQEPELAVFTD